MWLAWSLYASQAPSDSEGSRMLSYSWRWVKINIKYIEKTGPRGKNTGSGEDDWQVARQEGVAGDADLLRRSAQEMA
jgi:hypothetical protein